MKNPILRTIIAIVIGFLVLAFSSALMMSILDNTSLLDELPAIKNTLQHTTMLLFAILFILILSKGRLKEYGFKINLNFPIINIVIVSLLFGLLSSLVGKFFVETTVKMPMGDFSFIEKVLYIWFWASICEEVLTRGLIQGFLAPLKHIGMNISKCFISLPVIVGAIFFGAMHFMLLTLGVDIFKVLNIFFFGTILGLIAGYQREKTGSLIPAIIVHLCFNVGGSFLSMTNLL